MDRKVWYINGASKGLGLALIKKLLDEGHRVAATSHILPTLIEAIGTMSDDHFLPLPVGLSDPEAVADSLQTTYDAFGRIDVVVNNAGFGIGNEVFNAITVIQQATHRLRALGGGHIINIAAFTGPAAKQAIIQLSETLDMESRHLGIRVIAVASGAVQNNDADGIHITGDTHSADDARCADDTHTAGDAHYADAPRQARVISIDGRQIGDPTKAAAAILQCVAAPEPPTLLVLGTAYRIPPRELAFLQNQ